MSQKNGSEALAQPENLVAEVSRLINQRTGIQLGPKQVAMVESRLKRRSYELGLSGIEQYRTYFAENRAEEIEALVSILTTHHTFFFREFMQFEFLEEKLPALVAAVRARGEKTLTLYSAACSRGQEVYSLAMHLHHHLKAVAPDFDFKIFGSDVDPESVEVARNGVYRRAEIKSAPLVYLQNHWAKGTGEIAEFVKVKKELRAHCDFATVNLLDLKGVEGRKFDVIFCRNVFIYFTPQQITTITNGLLKHLQPEGMFFVGVSESLHSLGLPVQAIGSSVYQRPLASVEKKQAKVAPALAGATVPKAAPAPTAAIMPNPLRVVCVDDSPSIISLLKKILGREHGFEVVGVAVNGQEAEAVIEKEKPHVITLDIHMPVKTGLEFLAATSGRPRPPVLMVTSVSRDDSTLAWKALSLGAADYVEKPSLNNLEERADEIRTKLRSAYRAKEKKVPRALDKEFARVATIAKPEECAILCAFSLSELDQCAKVLRELKALKVPLYLALEGADAILPSVAERLTAEAGFPIKEGFPAPALGSCGLGNLKAAVKAMPKKATVVLVFGEISKHGAESILSLAGAQLLLEDLGGGKGAPALADVASDVVLSTSFAYLAQKFLAEPKARG